jgi:hypothetical protein
MREPLRTGSIIVVSLGLLVLTSALGAISIADRIQPSARTSEHTLAVTSPIAAIPTMVERDALEPKSLGYVEFDWDAANRVPGFKVN